MEPVKRTDWQTLPLSEKRTKLALNKIYAKEFATQITNGFKPQAMEDKWFMFYESDTLFIHRSWTGIGMYEVHFTPQGDALRATQAYVNRDQEQYRYTSDEKDIETIYGLIDTFLLHKSISGT